MPDNCSVLSSSETREARVERLLAGTVDLHCHSGPSVMPRDLDHIEAVQEAAEVGMRAVLFKDHYYSATPIVSLLERHYGDLGVKMLSGVPLNNTAGGLNPYAVDHGLALGARLIWMPTFSAANHIRLERRDKVLPTSMELMHPKMLTVVDDMGRITDEVKVILDQIAAADAVLSGGHLHISEMWPLFEEAKRRGVNRRLVNHPTFVVGATVADIRDLAGMDIYIEHSMCMFTPDCRFKIYEPEIIDELIKAGGFARTILGSDLGQTDNPRPVEGFRRVIGVCLDLGYSDEQIRALTGGNAARLMGLD